MTFSAVMVGHRGWPERYPDNTLAGFLAASAVVSEVELDVRRSGDGKLILSHDPTLGGMPVHETDWAVLAEQDLGDGHHPALLDEVVAALPGTRVQFEIKNDPWEPGFEPDHRRALEAAERARPGDIITSFNPETLKRVREVFSEMRTGYLVTGGGSMAELVEHCRSAGHEMLIPDHRMITEPMKSVGGLSYGTWTVNDVDRAKQLADWGVESIITDNPGLLSQHLEEN